MQFRFLKRHPKTFVGFGAHAAKLQKQKQMLEREKAATMPPRRQGEIGSLMGIVRNDGFKQAVAVRSRHAQMERGGSPEKAA
ncbi:hypothetical protein GCM10016234_39780 [Tianweitania populi]|uniref:Uncharacterized protein n=1 Tax=Tianweitania populi TaxID=1607949 RepID=A0A8J3DZD3_9HYPH|nr:hypothetical protein GCM10016234_39780 [Tianweitania populi]